MNFKAPKHQSTKLLFKFLMLLCFINFSCQKEEAIDITGNKEQFTAPTIDKAQQFYLNQNSSIEKSFTSRTTVTSHIAWEKSKNKNYKQTDSLTIDILYTPMYLNTRFNAKAFIAMTSSDNIVDAKKMYVLYKTNDISNGLSAYIVFYNLDGTFNSAYNYLNGVQIPFPTPSNSSLSRTTDCNEANVEEMTDEEFEEYLANCYSMLDEVTVVATIDAGPSDGGGMPLDQTNGGILNISFIDVLNNPTTGGNPSGTNVNVFAPNVVNGSPSSIAFALNIPFSSLEFNWLLQQQVNNQSLLNAIAAYLNANKLRPPNPNVFENADPIQFPVIQEIAINLVLEIIEIIMNGNSNNISFEEIEQLYNGGMDKECPKNIITSFIINTDTPLVNVIVNAYFGNDDFNLEFLDQDLDPDLDAVASTVAPNGMNFNDTTAAVVIFDNSYLDNATNLSMALETAHELVHVYLMYLFDQDQLLLFYPNITDMYNAFQEFKNNPSIENYNNLQDSMHAQYDNFINWIESAVNTYAANNNISVTQEFIKKLVIGSHQYSDAFQNLSEGEQIEYSTIAYNEQNGTNNAKGTPCND